MLIFNTTFHVEDEVHASYMEFMLHTYIPQAIETGVLEKPCFARINGQHEKSGTSYSLQLKVKDMETLNRWFSQQGTVLQQKLVEAFTNKVVGFITIMDEIDVEQ